MAGKQEEIDSIMVLGSTVMILLALSIIVFVIVYQRRMFAKQNKINELIIDNQKRLIEAEIEVAEREQKRIAQDLHDDIGASLTSLRFLVSQISSTERVKEKMLDTLGKTTEKVKSLCNELLPYVLQELGLHDAISHLIASMDGTSNVKITYLPQHIDESIKLDKGVELSLYRIIQELLNNIVKYAEASEVKVCLSIMKSQLYVSIEDNGNGVIPEITPNTRSLGLKNIQSRLQYINGEMTRTKAEPRGTLVEIKKELV